MPVNDGNGLFDKYGLLKEMETKMDVLGDTKGAIRCGLIWDVFGMIKALENGLKKEDDAHAREVSELKSIIEKENVDHGSI